MLMVGKFFFGEEVFFIFQKLFSSYGVLHALEVIFQLREMGKFVMFFFFLPKLICKWCKITFHYSLALWQLEPLQKWGQIYQKL